METCCFCCQPSSLEREQLAACFSCGYRYHKACHLPSIDSIFIANQALRWYCAPCNEKGWHSSTPPIANTTASNHDEGNSRDRKRSRIEGINDTDTQVLEHPTPNFIQKPEREYELEGQKTTTELPQQRQISLQQQWHKLFKVINRQMKGINQQISCDMTELVRRQNEIDDIADLRQSLEEETQEKIALQRVIEERDNTIEAQALKIDGLEKRAMEYKTKLSKLKQWAEENA